ncbi:AAA family ATPase (plasmid) [Streptomyces sp. NBC_00513]|uniref:AAA family ATPase n=1 Tax=unclassified Streptomyces TaxID=2593676 RepID=UPI00224CB7B6|nr:AAA family ATPase [Streptomyces sp. NBC_00424]MCX5079189.1 AAA family ATPase [Streptomyces sp. NBC_00424]WUD46375.1 AAA family ATPase [Streptomyces sp. NBC_00513]
MNRHDPNPAPGPESEEALSVLAETAIELADTSRNFAAGLIRRESVAGPAGHLRDIAGRLAAHAARVDHLRDHASAHRSEGPEMNPLDLPAGAICVMVGPPGSGKSTFAARYPDTWRVSLDLYRHLATDSETDQSSTPVAVEIQNLLLDARLARGLTTIVDSTNVHVHVRNGLLARARYWQRPAIAVLFDVPLATVEAQNAGRDRAVPVHIVRGHHQLLPTPARLHDEGFTGVYRISELTAGTPQ